MAFIDKIPVFDPKKKKKKRDGHFLASQLGITQLVVELDAKVVVGLVLSKNNLQLGERVYEGYWSGNQHYC